MIELLFDAETDGITPSRIHCVGIYDMRTGAYDDYNGINRICEAMFRLAEADRIIGHNIRKYDCYHMQRLSEGLVTFDDSRIVDTLEMSRSLCKMPRHGLEAWGNMFGYPKLPKPDFSRWTPTMSTYMERDVRLNVKVYELLLELQTEREILMEKRRAA